MKILAIESSCDETAASVVENGRQILSSVVHSQLRQHEPYGGVVPEIASRIHTESIVSVVQKALESCGVTFDTLDAVAVTYGPGLIGSLLVGLGVAKGLSFATGLPLVPVHHLRSHVAANYVAYPNLEPPFLCLVVSGGHSSIIRVLGYTKFEVIGKTCDDAVGEAFDKVARVLGLPYPGGVNLDRISKTGDKTSTVFPSPKTKSSPYDFSFSGLKTFAVNEINKKKQKGSKISLPDFAASFCYSAVNHLLTKFLGAANELRCKKLAVAGGVSANSLLRKELKRECDNRGIELFIPPVELCTDNAVMVASQGYYEFISKNVAALDVDARANIDIASLV
ncbi:MAG: tRNA (adenosine(37)-N6)-threonylcarbamoyltransferase complex transferase subunit TsaD [Oscillospiraceae bacterium]|jgi:N6-L-threonylcarbamoyladenine synthase|nr:tRNA (adenosine(37)-N6)-threonylcarbamoyltransferase complex transferase subunit TsaD [Oscillospiraceae bacterium]